jgi:hypothetical protein
LLAKYVLTNLPIFHTFLTGSCIEKLTVVCLFIRSFDLCFVQSHHSEEEWMVFCVFVVLLMKLTVIINTLHLLLFFE